MKTKILSSLLIVSTFVSSLLGAPPEVPKEVKGDPGQIVRIEVAVPKDTEIGFQPAFDDSKTLFEELVPRGNKRRFMFQSMTAGTFSVVFWTKGELVGSTCVVTIGTPTPVPPPTPPTPPAPTDPLTIALQTAYNRDQDVDRAKWLEFLQFSYKGMAAQAAARPERTNADFVKWMKLVVEAPGVGMTNQLKSLRTTIAVELGSAWGANTAPLTPTDAAAELSKIATALSGVK